MLDSKTALLGGVIFSAALFAACSSTVANSTGGTTGTGGTGGAETTSTTSSGSTTSTTTSTSSTTTSSGAGGAGSLADDPPLVLDNGGTVLSSPKVQVIGWASDPELPDTEAAVMELGSTAEWSEQTSEYGVGPFTMLPTISQTGTPPTSIDDQSGNVTPFEMEIAQNLSGSDPAWGQADASTIYMFLLPKGTNIESGGSCCNDFLGYHWEAPVGSINVSYAIVCDCGTFMGSPLTQLQWITTTINHELAEAATDPFPGIDPAWTGTDSDHLAWTVATGGEIADMCEYNADSNYTPPGSTYMIQRSWSNAAAKAGKNPCVPVPPTGPYFNSIPVLTDTVEINAVGVPQPTKGVIIPVGQSKTIDVKLEAQGATSGPWKVTPYDLNTYLGSGSPFLKLTLNPTSGVAGDVLQLTIQSLKADTQDVSAVFLLQSDIGSGANLQENLMFGAVGQ